MLWRRRFYRSRLEDGTGLPQRSVALHASDAEASASATAHSWPPVRAAVGPPMRKRGLMLRDDHLDERQG